MVGARQLTDMPRCTTVCFRPPVGVKATSSTIVAGPAARVGATVTVSRRLRWTLVTSAANVRPPAASSRIWDLAGNRKRQNQAQRAGGRGLTFETVKRLSGRTV